MCTKVIYLMGTIKTQMNLVPFCFSADWAIRAILKKGNFRNFSFKMYFLGQNRLGPIQLSVWGRVKSRSVKKSVFIVFGMYKFGVHLSGTGVTWSFISLVFLKSSDKSLTKVFLWPQSDDWIWALALNSALTQCRI